MTEYIPLAENKEQAFLALSALTKQTKVTLTDVARELHEDLRLV